MKKIITIIIFGIILLIILAVFSSCQNNNLHNVNSVNNVKYVQTGFIREYNPVITVITSRTDIENYYMYEHENNKFFTATTEYTDDFFVENYLEVINLGDGFSVRHEVKAVEENGNIIINRLLPRNQLLSMIYSTIIIEFDNSFKPEQFGLIIKDKRVS